MDWVREISRQDRGFDGEVELGTGKEAKENGMEGLSLLLEGLKGSIYWQIYEWRYGLGQRLHASPVFQSRSAGLPSPYSGRPELIERASLEE